MKRWIALILALVMVLPLAACGGGAATDGRALYDAAMQLVYADDLSGGIEGLKKAVAAKETETWTEADIWTAYTRMAQLYFLLGDAEGQAQVYADYTAATGNEGLGINEYYFDGAVSLNDYFDVSPFEDWGSNILVYDLRDAQDMDVFYNAFPEKAAEMGDEAFFEWIFTCTSENLYALVSTGKFGSMTLDSYMQANPKDRYNLESPFVTFSACGLMTGMTREQVYAQLQMTPWAQTVANHSPAAFSWTPVEFPDGTTAYRLGVDTRRGSQGGISLVDMSNGGVISLKFENDVLTWMQYRNH